MDILTRLLLNTDGFDAKLNSSEKGVQSFEGTITSMASKAGAGVLKLAGGIGVAMGSVEAFNKTLMSSQSTGDAFVKIQDQAKASVDSFFASIAMGDFSGYLENLQNVINKAGDLSTALDYLATKTLFNNSEVNELNAKYQLEINMAKARNISDEERNKHLEKAKTLLSQMATLQQSLAVTNKETSYTQLQAEAAKQGYKYNIKKDTWDYLIKDSNRGKVEQTAAAHKANVTEYDRKITNAQLYDPTQGKYIDTAESKKLAKELQNYMNSAAGRYGELTKIFIEMADEETSAIGKALRMRDTANNLSVSISQKQLEIANADAKINGSYNKNTSGKKPKVDNVQLIAANSEAWAKQEALGGTKFKQPLEQPLKIVPLPISTEEILEEALPQSELEIKLKAKLENAEYAKKKIAELKELMEVATTPEEKKQLSGQMDEWAQFGGILNQDSIKQNNDYAESLQNIGGIMHTLSGITDESTAAWMNWGANTITAISQAIPAIMSLTTANTAKAASEAASSAAQIPFVGWLSAAGAALSVVAAMSSIPKCANGGIAYGNSIVNVGEYAGASGNPEVIAPLSKLREYIQPREGNNTPGGEVVFTISGTSLKGVLTNVERKHKKFS